VADDRLNVQRNGISRPKDLPVAPIKLFDIVGGGEKADWEKNLIWLRIFLLMHVACRTIIAQHNPALDQEPWLAVMHSLLIAVCLAGLIPRVTWLATVIATGLLGIQVLGTMPITANHIFLEFLCLALLGLLHESRIQERDLAVKALRWLVVIMLFHSGFQKLVYGYYFDGQFLAYATATEDRLACFFRFFMPADEFARLRSLRDAALGMGPYRVNSALFVAISNIAYLFELAAPALLAVRKTRSFAVIATILFVVAIEAGARELLFGALVINLLLLSLPGQWNKRLFPLFAGCYLYVVVANFDWLPMFRYYH